VLESRLLVRRGLAWLLAAALVLPGSVPLLLVLLLCGGWGEWRARAADRSQDLSWRDFARGWLWDALAYSVGHAEGWLRAALADARRKPARRTR
jgi:hypothetical protein